MPLFIFSRNRAFRWCSLLLRRFEAYYHTSHDAPPRFAPKTRSHPNRSHPSSDLFQNPTPMEFRKSNFEPSTVLETLNCYGNDWKRGLEFFNWSESQLGCPHSTETYNRMIDILGKFFEFDIAWSLIRRMGKDSSFVPNHTTFRVLFKRYVSAHLVNEAIDIFGRLDEYNLKDEISFSIFIDALCEYGHVTEAEEICFQKSRGNEYNGVFAGFNVETTKIYNMVMRGWLKTEWWSKCRHYWHEMDKRGVKKDLFSYTIYMDVQCKCGKPWKAVSLYKEMKKKEIQPDVVAYNTVIQAAGKLEGADMAVRVYRDMIEQGCNPSVVTFNTILKLLSENGRYREARRMLGVMTRWGCEPNVMTYNCFFSCLEKPREILKLFDQMIERGIRPRIDTYVMLMRKFGRWGFLRPVITVWRKMEEMGESPDEFAYNALIDALIQKGLVDMARKYDQEMYDKGLSAKRRAHLWENVDGEPFIAADDMTCNDEDFKTLEQLL